MGLCASKDKKEKVIEGEVANGEPNGTATAAAAGEDGCVSRGSGHIWPRSPRQRLSVSGKGEIGLRMGCGIGIGMGADVMCVSVCVCLGWWLECVLSSV